MLGDLDDDRITTGPGDDSLSGGDSQDTLTGNAGADRFSAGLGQDLMFGGLGLDTFVFGTAADLSQGAATDTIADFTTRQDKIDLSALGTLTFIGGQAFSLTAGEVRYVKSTGLVTGDLDGDGLANFSLQLQAGKALAAGDFIF